MFRTLKEILLVLIEIKKDQEVIKERLGHITKCVTTVHGATKNYSYMTVANNKF